MNKFLSHVMSDELVNDGEWDDCDDDFDLEEIADWNDFDENFEEDPIDDSPWVKYDDE